MAADIPPPPGNGPPCFGICGQIHHRYGVLHPGDNEQPQYNQLYIHLLFFYKHQVNLAQPQLCLNILRIEP